MGQLITSSGTGLAETAFEGIGHKPCNDGLYVYAEAVDKNVKKIITGMQVYMTLQIHMYIIIVHLISIVDTQQLLVALACICNYQEIKLINKIIGRILPTILKGEK